LFSEYIETFNIFWQTLTLILRVIFWERPDSQQGGRRPLTTGPRPTFLDAFGFWADVEF